MVTVTYQDELEVNAVTDALNRLLASESATLARLGRIRCDLQEERDTPENMAALRDNDFAIETVRAAIKHAMTALLRLAEALPDAEHPPEVTFEMLAYRVDAPWTVLESEARAMWGDR